MCTVFFVCLGAFATSAGAQPSSCYSANHKLSVAPCPDSIYQNLNQTGQKFVWNWGDITDGSVDHFHVTCSGIVTSCSISLTSSTDPSGVDTVTYTTGTSGTGGTIILTMTDSVGGVQTVTATLRILTPFTISTAFTNATDQSLARCAQSCFAAVVAIGTPSYYSLDQPRGISLVYNGDRVRARPFIYADVGSAGTSLPNNYQMQVTSGGAKLRFTNGDSVLTFASGVTGRIGGQLALDSTLVTAPLAITVTVMANYPSGTQSFSTPFVLAAVNERNSTVAHGWTLGGIQHLYAQSSSASVLITEGDGSAEVFTSCSSGACAPPAGEYSALSYIGAFPGSGYVRSYPDSTKVLFNNLGQMMKMTDAFGNSDSLAYDAQGRLIALYDPFRPSGTGRSYIQLVYGSTYGISSITTPGANGSLTGGRTSTFRINASDSTLAAMYDPDGDSTVFGYDSRKRLSWERNRRGDTTKFGYDTLSFKLTSVTTPPVPVDNGFGSTTLESVTTTYSPWQVQGVPTSPTSPSSPWPLGSQSPSGSVTDPASHTTSFTVNRWGEALVMTNAAGAHATVSIADSNPVAQQIFTTRGGEYRLTWSGATLTSSTPPGGGTSTMLYNSGYSVADSIVVPGQPAQRRFIGAGGRIDSVRFASTLGRKIQYTYDTHGRVLQMTDIHGHVTTYHYETVFGNLDSTQGPGSSVTVKRFDRFGRDSAVTLLGLAQTVKLYDSLNRVIQLQDGVNPNPTTWTYDPLYLIRVLDPKGQLHKQDVDALGHTSRIYDVGDTTKYTSYRYSADGLLTGRNNRDTLRKVVMTYDRVHRLLSSTRTVSGAKVAVDSFAYDVNGLQTVRWNSAARDSVFVDPNGWTDSTITHFANVRQRFKIRYGHDTLGRHDTTVVTDSIGVQLLPRYLSFDSATGAVSKIALSSGAGLTTTFGINTEFHSVKVSFPGTGGVGQPGSLQDTLTSSHLPFQRQFTSSVLDNPMNQKAGFDSLGRLRTSITVNTALNQWSINRYWYDQLGRLQSRHWKDSTGLCSADTTYGYQCLGVTQVDTLAYDAANNLVGGEIFGDSAKGVYRTGNRDTTLFGVHHTFDSDGNVLTNDSRQFKWGVEGYLDSVVTGSVVLHYEYDALGRLVKRSRNGSLERLFLWDGSQLLAEFDASGTQRIGEYVSMGTDAPFAFIAGLTSLQSVSYYIRDPVGSTVGLVRSDSNGTQSVREQYSYLVLGAPLTPPIDSGLANRMQWKGMVYEGDSTRLYYARSRWYDPQQGRFMSEDPLGFGGGLNQYTFASSDPINGSDPSGQCDPTQCTLTLFGDGIYGWDLASSCMGCDPGVDPLSLAYGDNMPEDMELEETTPGWCGHGFNKSQCNALNDAIIQLMNSNKFICAWMGEDAYNAFNAGNISFAGPQEVDRLYAMHKIRSKNIGGVTDPDQQLTEITSLAFAWWNPMSLTNTIAHEMVHYNGLDRVDDGGDLPADTDGGPTLAYQVGATCQKP